MQQLLLTYFLNATSDFMLIQQLSSFDTVACTGGLPFFATEQGIPPLNSTHGHFFSILYSDVVVQPRLTAGLVLDHYLGGLSLDVYQH